MGPVYDLTGDKVFVGYQELTPIAGDDGNIARAELVDPSECVANADHITRLHRLVEEDDDAGYEV